MIFHARGKRIPVNRPDIVIDENEPLYRSMYCIKMAKNNLNATGLRALYYALTHSHVNYCPIIMNCLSKSNKNKLF